MSEIEILCWPFCFDKEAILSKTFRLSNRAEVFIWEIFIPGAEISVGKPEIPATNSVHFLTGTCRWNHFARLKLALGIDKVTPSARNCFHGQKMFIILLYFPLIYAIQHILPR